MTIRIGIMGYGNLGRGVECALTQNQDMELSGVFTRRKPESLKLLTKDARVFSIEDAPKMADLRRRYDPLRRQRYGLTQADPIFCSVFQFGGQL